MKNIKNNQKEKGVDLKFSQLNIVKQGFEIRRLQLIWKNFKIGWHELRDLLIYLHVHQSIIDQNQITKWLHPN